SATQVFEIVQGALNLDQVMSPDTQVYRGQKGLRVSLIARNTSLAPVTLTAAALTFNNQANYFTFSALPDNPVLIPGQATFTLRFNVDVGKDAPVGNTVLDGSLAGGGVIPAIGAQQTASWQILEAKNELSQNYPNPFKGASAGNKFTTFDYFVKDDVTVTLKIYNLAGELVAVLVDANPGIGKHSVSWNGGNGDPGQTGKPLGSGVYLAVLQTGSYKEIRKVVVIR
ncbi:MAG: T9SS type A sorting domain-containing protein, partial [Candidatus Firestonebacteria bacterium]|nr:T9SS type A sorting domain-containing protein [Candidatus Firestonebacteria bacterium]